jgi:cytochrome c biogenesis protein CcmG/thiol:disulfide interchange protein DsbE
MTADGPDVVEEPVELDRPAPGRRTALFAAVALAVILALFVVVLASSDPSRERGADGPGSERADSPLIGQLAPATAGATLDGGTVSIDDARGRWVVVNFFASWCTPCIEEHDELAAFDAVHRRAGDAVLVSVTYDNDADDARAFFARNGGTWPVIDDPENRLGVAYGVAQVPESFVISPDGIVVHRFAGGVTRAMLDEVIDFYEGGAG